MGTGRGSRSPAGRRGPREKRDGSAGFTLLEVVLAGVILVVSLGGMLASVLSSDRLQQASAERSLAVRAAESRLEALQGADFETLFATWQGTTFDVPGLSPQEGQVAVGTIEFPTVGGELREDADDPGLGMPRDLNGDGRVDGDDRAGDYRLLPVRVRVAWRGAAGEAQVELQTFLCDWRP